MLAMLQLTAQTTRKSISGQVKDTQNEPVAGATVWLQKANDTTPVQKLITKDNGRFQLTNLANGLFVLNITSLGSKKYQSAPLAIDDSHAAIALPVIILLPAKQAELKEVTVTSKKPLIEQDIDKTIVNVEAMISSAGSNTLEVLEKTPGITIGSDGDISLNGKSGVIVLIEGRPTYMSGSDLMAYLKSIPGSTLDKIELMSNPPAKYDAAGGAVINIRFKKNRVQGYTGNIALSFAQGVNNRSYNSLNLNYLNRKVNLFATINVNKDRGFDDDSYQRTFYNTGGNKIAASNLHNYYTYHLHDVTGRVGMDYTISPKTIVGFIASVYGRKKYDNSTYNNHLFNEDNNAGDSSGYGVTRLQSTFRQVTANINLQHKFNNKGRELTADINYINYNNRATQLLDNFIQLPGTDSNYTFTYNLPYNINIYTAKADYSHPLAGKATFSAGVKSSIVNNSNQSDHYDVLHGSETWVPASSNHYAYTENINAAYINLRKDWQRLGMQLGLRVENTNTRGHLLGNTAISDSTTMRHYTGMFPSLFVSYKLDSSGNNTLSLSFSRRIIRPNYQQLNPFTLFVDQYTYNTGNPYLVPMYSNSIEAAYRYRQWLTISLQYDGQTNSFFNATKAVGPVFMSRPENAGHRYMIGFFTNLNLNPVKWWRININMATARFATRGSLYGQSLSQTLQAYRINTISQVTLSNTFSAEFSTRYTSRIINLQREYWPRYSINAGIQKKILNNKGSLRINVDDILWSLKQKERTTGLYLTDAFHTNVEDTRRVAVSFTYSFGKETFARKRRYNDNAADDVKGRVE